MNYTEQFFGTLIDNSEGSAMGEAMREWNFHSSFSLDFPDTTSCICGKENIVHVFVIKNRKNQNRLWIGSSCIKKFFPPSDAEIILDLGKIYKERDATVKQNTITDAYKHGVVTEWEHDFYSDTRRKRNLSFRQLELREKINNKLLNRF